MILKNSCIIHCKFEMKHIKEVKLLWQILTIIGIRISDYCLNPYQKCLTWMFEILSILLPLHWILASIYRILRYGDFHIRQLAYLLMPVQFILIRYFLNVQRATMRYIIRRLYMYKIVTIQRVSCTNHFIQALS